MALVKRHMVKAVTYRCLGTCQTLLISYALTGSMKIAGTAGTIEIFLKPLMYYLHERVWYRWIHYDLGRKKGD